MDLLLLVFTAVLMPASYFCSTQSGYLLSLPAVIVRNSSTSVCVTFHNLQHDVTMTLTLRALRRDTTHTQQERFPRGVGRCIDLDVPIFISRREAELTARVVAHIPGGDEVIPAQRRYLRVVVRNSLVWIETDRPVYKPGQKVHIRMLTMDMRLRPIHQTVSSIWVENPDGYRIRQWSNTTVTRGITDVDLKLNDRAELGIWRIYAEVAGQQEERSFQVKEYVLPKFEVRLNGPANIEGSSEQFIAQLCSHYMYGKPVRGNYSLWACSGATDCQQRHGQVTGCTNVTIEAAAWTGTNGKHASSVEMYANVTDLVLEDVIMSPLVSVAIMRTEVEIDFASYSSPYFKLGIPYKGKVRVTYPDGTAAAGLSLELVSIHTITWETLHSSSITLDEAGENIFTVPSVESGVDAIRIKLTALLPGAVPVSEYLDLSRWYSPTGNLLQISPAETVGSCSRSITLNTTVVSPAVALSNITLHYQVLSKTKMYLKSERRVEMRGPVPTSQGPVTERTLPESVTLGHAAEPRRYLDRWRNVVIIPDPSVTIGYHGTVTEWRIYSEREASPRRKEKVFVQVWRPVPATPGQKSTKTGFQLVGQTSIRYRTKGTYAVVDDIQVQPHDVIGLYFPNKNPIPFDARECPHDTNADTRPGGTGTSPAAFYRRYPGNLKAEKNFQFNQINDYRWFPCRLYSIQATVRVDMHLNLGRHHESVYKELELDVVLPEPLPPVSHVVVYYVTDSGETVADTVRVDATPCLPNQAETRFLQTERYPGDEVSLEISAAAGSFCAVGVVDRSVHSIQKASTLTAHKAYKQIDEESSGKIEQMRQCSNSAGLPMADSLDSFQLSGTVFMSNLKVENKICTTKEPPLSGSVYQDLKIDASHMNSNNKRRGPGVLMSSPPLFVKAQQDREDTSRDALSDVFGDFHAVNPGLPSVDRRFYFPDTWIWKTQLIGRTGSEVLSERLPHTLTEWTGNAICLHPTQGLGISAPASIRAFQPFFLTFSLPYSIVTSEELIFPVAIYSYLDECFELEVSIDTERLGVFGLAAGEERVVYCMCGQESKAVRYTLVPLIPGKQEISFKARAVSNQGVCTRTSGLIHAQDTVTKTIVVKAEGMEQEHTQSALVCPMDANQEVIQYMNISMPEKVVAGSAYAYISTVADVMGPTLQNLHKMVRLPTGCGEQSLAALAVNVHVLDYLEATGITTRKHREKAMDYVQQGYQKQVQYRRSDGSYSAFGKGDAEGSVWLTAFVVKTFALARSYSYIDYNAYRETLTWLKSQQDSDGCFSATGMVHNKKIRGGYINTDTPSKTAITAYVVAALLEAGESKYSPSVERGVRCLDDAVPRDIYSLALMTYAYSVYDVRNLKRVDCLQKLRDEAVMEGGMKYWVSENMTSSPGRREASPLDVEITAYVLLSLMRQHSRANIVEGSKIVRWLTLQRNSYGGFKSTQDTTVAINALTRYARETYVEDIAMTAQFYGTGLGGSISVNSTNRMLVQRKERVRVPNQMRIVVTGVGCMILQSTLIYNTMSVVKPDPIFTLDVTVHSIPHPESGNTDCPRFHCFLRRLQICTSYTGEDDKSNMAIVEIGMLSGWEPHMESVQQLKETNSMVSHHEERDDQLHLYFIEINQHHMCFDVHVVQAYDVKERQPAFIKVYDYYDDHDKAKIQSYHIEEVCTEDEKDLLCHGTIS